MFEKNSERTILFLYNCIFTRFFNKTVVITVPKSDETPRIICYKILMANSQAIQIAWK